MRGYVTESQVTLPELTLMYTPLVYTTASLVNRFLEKGMYRLDRDQRPLIIPPQALEDL